VGPPRDVAFRSQQLALIDVSAGGGADQEGLDLPAQIASLERELRYYRRVIPALTRASVRPRRPSLEQAGELTHLARWLTDGHRVIDTISRTLAEQRQLEIRLEALERAHRQVRDEVAQLFADESDEPDAGPGLFGSGWVRAGLVVLILVIVAVVSVPYLLDWWQSLIPPRHG
jgi:hypothetical protein